MFCPKCGGNCGGSNYCHKCRIKITVEASEFPVWAPGMACPHCGGRELEGKNCAYCGSLLVTEKQSGSIPFRSSSEPASGPHDLGYYYQRYKDDKEAALRALRVDTGMGPLEAQKKIDQLFSYYQSCT